MQDEDQHELKRNTYEPYGGPSVESTFTDGPGYTGHVTDANTGLIYMQQRYYDAIAGRFLSNDPVAAIDDGGGFNRYWYANNNPYRFTDPDGRDPEWIAQVYQMGNPAGGNEVGPVGIVTGVGVFALGAGVASGPAIFSSALANLPAVNSMGINALEFAAGDALGGTSLAASVSMTVKQLANLARFEKSMPTANTGVAVDALGDGLVFTSTVPGKVPGSQAVYQKTVDAAGETTGLLKTTTDPAGEVMHVKDKLNNSELPKY